jgi:hypothetical protein
MALSEDEVRRIAAERQIINELQEAIDLYGRDLGLWVVVIKRLSEIREAVAALQPWLERLP